MKDPFTFVLQNISFRHLHYFILATEHGSFRKAAYAIGVQQSGISRCVRDLEDRLGASLFHRQTVGVELTLAGKAFLPYARQILRNLEEGLRATLSHGRSDTGYIKAGIYSSIASGFLAELLHSFSQEFRDVQIELIDGTPEEHIAAIRKLKLDIAFLAGTQTCAGCESAMMWAEGIFVAVPSGHRLSSQETVDWADLRHEPFIVSEIASGRDIYRYIVNKLAELSWHPEIRVHTVSRDNLLSLVAIGRDLTIVSESMTATRFPGVVFREIKGEFAPFSAIWSPSNDNPAFRRLISMAKTKAPLDRSGMFSPGALETALLSAASQTLDPSQ